MLRYLHVPCDNFSSFATGRTALLMHGFGATAENLLSLVSMLDAERRYNWIMPLAPFPLYDPESEAFLGYAWFPKERERQLEAFHGNYFRYLARVDGDELPGGAQAIEHLRATLQIPYSSLVIGGFSQGAIMAVEFLLHAPEPCAGALLFSGALIAKARWEGAKPVARGTPFLQTHGRDDDILPFSAGTALHELLRAKGFEGTFTDFEGGHSIPQQKVADAAETLRQWRKRD